MRRQAFGHGTHVFTSASEKWADPAQDLYDHDFGCSIWLAGTISQL